MRRYALRGRRVALFFFSFFVSSLAKLSLPTLFALLFERQFSGHHGTWVQNDFEAQIFDHQYYRELAGRSWSPRSVSNDAPLSDFTTTEVDDPKPKMMLNTDICLVFDLESSGPCCTRTDLFKTNGESHCQTMEEEQCPVYDGGNPRLAATEAVAEYAEDNANFYEAFRQAWFKATTNGNSNLQQVVEEC
jgi:hypothetical protein